MKIDNLTLKNNILLAQDIARLAGVDEIPEYQKDFPLDPDLSKDELLLYCQSLIK